MNARIRIIAFVAASFLVSRATFPGFLPMWPVEYEVLKSQLIVQGRLTEQNQVLVEKVFFGPARPSENIQVDRLLDLPLVAFPDLRTYLESRKDKAKQGEPVKGQPVVLFLHRPKDTGNWQPYGWGAGVKWLIGSKVYGYWQIFNPGPYLLTPDRELKDAKELLEAIAKALEKRARYEAALNQKDVEVRIKALLEFIQPSESHLYFNEALKSLEEVGPQAGEALRKEAERPGQDELRRQYLLSALGGCQDRGSVPYLLEVIAQTGAILQKVEGEFDWLKASHEEQKAVSEWKTAIYAVAQIGDERALPALRNALLWGAEHKYLEIVETAAMGLRKNPVQENLPAFKEVLELLPRDSKDFGTRAAYSSLRSLAEHKFTDAVPILASQLDHPDESIGRQAHRGLTDIVGKDLGMKEKPWLEWCDENKKR
jgi:hypothetical protein